ncbi:hypothetical protein Dimus_037956 [Dionaea muscipula]
MSRSHSSPIMPQNQSEPYENPSILMKLKEIMLKTKPIKPYLKQVEWMLSKLSNEVSRSLTHSSKRSQEVSKAKNQEKWVKSQRTQALFLPLPSSSSFLCLSFLLLSFSFIVSAKWSKKTRF